MKGKIVWKSGEETQHKLDVERERTLPRFFPIIEPDVIRTRELAKGPGVMFVTRRVMRQLDDVKRIAPLLHAQQRINADKLETTRAFKPGALAIYLGQERSPEWRSGHEVSVLRHIFLIGGVRWMVEDINELDPL